jgi:XRE family transcriptional regulator, regulator of sulfur utilization
MDQPAAVAAHLGRNLSTLRHTRGLTQAALAKAADLPRSTVANLESGEGNPSLIVLVKVADALGVPVDELLASGRTRVRLWRAAEVAEQRIGHGLKARPLVPEPAPDETMTIMSFEPGGGLKGTPHLPGTREYFSCLDGRVSIGVAGERFELAPGDVLGFPGNLPHAYQNLDRRAGARGVSVVILAKATASG